MLVLLTGATGFVGTYVTRTLLEHGHRVRALVRPGSEGDLAARGEEGVTLVQGDITESVTLGPACDGVDAVVHLVGIIDEAPSEGVTFERIHVKGTRNVVAAAVAAGVSRYVHMSANGAAPDGPSGYQTTKWRAEQVVKEAGFDHWVIFRPSILFGDPGPGRPEFASRLWKELVRPFPVLPILGDGRYELQPIHVETVADAFAQAVARDASHETIYCAAGPERLPFNELVDRIAEGAGIRPKPKVHIPMPLAKLGVATVGRAGLLPISPAQFAMLRTGNTCVPSAFTADFGPPSPRFVAEALHYLTRR